MAGRELGLSFERDGRSLDVWLQELVSDEASTRLAAAKALQAIQCGVTGVDAKLSDIECKSSRRIERRGGRFNEAVRAGASGCRFPTRDFVRRLVARRIALSDDWLARVRQDRDQPASGVEERLIQRLTAADTEAERIEATRRWMRWLCASINRRCKRGNAILAGAEAMSAAGFMAMNVFDALDQALLADREGLWQMLTHKDLYRDAARALGRIGPAAADFAGFFLEQLDAQEKGFDYNGAPALGSIGRDDPVVIDALLWRVRKGSDTVGSGAILALGHAGPLAGRLEVALDILLGATYKPALACAATWALASVGRDNEHVLRRVRELASPRPPRWRSDELHPEGRWNETMCERGSAISALRYFPQFSTEIVPVLVDAFDSFEEFDPDRDEHGEHGRVCRALGAFGAKAAPAAPRLARFLDELSLRSDDDPSSPDEVFRLLSSIGPPAFAALPALERFRARRAHQGETVSGSLDPDNRIDRAILAILGDL